MATIRPSHTEERVVLDLSNIRTRFVPTERQRKIRTATVKDLKEQFDAGTHFDAAICINRVTDPAVLKEYGESAPVERLFDGGHRFFAMEKYLEQNPSDSIEVPLHVYHNLSPLVEKASYTKVNRGTKQSPTDVVYQYSDDIDAYGWMQTGWTEKGGHKNFVANVCIYQQAGSVQFHKLGQAYLAAQPAKFQGGYMGNAFDFVDEAMQFKIDDVRVMNAFMHDFIDSFGPLKNNKFLGTTPFNALFRIWHENRATIAPQLMVSLFKTRIAANKEAEELGKSGGFGATLVAYRMFLLMLNAGRRKNLFVEV
jgi:hypothetical protein